MSAFKDQIGPDLNGVFLNPDEFAEPHQINKKSGVLCIFDLGDVPMDTGFKQYRGMEKGTATLLIRVSDLPGQVAIRRIVNIDNADYRITKVDENGGLYDLGLEAVTA